jgi:hypothetical protein
MAKAVTVMVEIAHPKVTLAEAHGCTLRKKYASNSKRRLIIY